MDKSNIFESSEFYMSAGDILHITVDSETGTTITIALQESDGVTETSPA